jgi:hypothetical protein
VNQSHGESAHIGSVPAHDEDISGALATAFANRHLVVEAAALEQRRDRCSAASQFKSIVIGAFPRLQILDRRPQGPAVNAGRPSFAGVMAS